MLVKLAEIYPFVVEVDDCSNVPSTSISGMSYDPHPYKARPIASFHEIKLELPVTVIEDMASVR